MTNNFLAKLGDLTKWTIVFFAFLPVFALTSCNDDDRNLERDEYIHAYPAPDSTEDVDVIYFSVLGGTEKVYVDANVDFVPYWQDAESSSWAKIVDYSATDPASGRRIITLEVEPRSTASCYYTRRTGMLILSPTDESLNYNKIISVHQGSTARVSNNFSFLRYGSTDPRLTTGEVSIDDWTAAQKDYGFTSTRISGESVTHCYGKNDYLKLGDDEGHGADLISPYTTTMLNDSLLMVSFRAVAYTDFYSGAKDNNEITVEVLDGGVIRDFAEEGRTSIELEVPNYDVTSEDFPSDMWKGSDFVVFICSTDLNPITINTRVSITAGSMSTPSSTNSRIFVDNFYIRVTEPEGEDYYTENNGSGKDALLGSQIWEEN